MSSTAARMPSGLSAELQLNTGRLATTLLLCAAALLWALLSTDQYAGLLTLWAALGWYRYGRADTAPREDLRASLGLSRADRVRGRLALIGLEHAAVIVTVAAGAVISVLLGRETAGGAAPFSFLSDPSAPQLLTVLVGALFSLTALVATGIVVGGECTIRRPGRSMAVLSILVYFLAGVLLGIPMALAEIALRFDLWAGPGGIAIIGAVLAAVLAVLLLRLRASARRWIRDLDSHRPRRAK
ncbi:hypothetical protein GCM10023160_29820 [Brachybacterium paraconglomeratum]|uniref:hypothetical protein n=1 Tax=Brachybacterium paraconglomeratum TaxID=173362 RepID=UPI0031EF6201